MKPFLPRNCWVDPRDFQPFTAAYEGLIRQLAAAPWDAPPGLAPQEVHPHA